MRVAAVQLCSGVDIDANLASAANYIRAAAADGAAFIATPEMTHILQRSPKRLFESIVAETQDKGVAFFASLAKELGVYLLIGSLAILKSEGRAANRSYVFGPDGRIVEKYDKIHLFDVSVSPSETWKESAVYDRGDMAVTANVDGVTLGLSICYDLRFASLYRHYAQMGAQILTVPAAFTKPTGEAHWEALLRARAIETGSFVIAPAQGGTHEDGRTTYGHSMIIGPWGHILAQMNTNEPGYVVADINLDDVSAARAKIPAWQHNPNYGSA